MNGRIPPKERSISEKRIKLQGYVSLYCRLTDITFQKTTLVTFTLFEYYFFNFFFSPSAPFTLFHFKNLHFINCNQIRSLPVPSFTFCFYFCRHSCSSNIPSLCISLPLVLNFVSVSLEVYLRIGIRAFRGRENMPAWARCPRFCYWFRRRLWTSQLPLHLHRKCMYSTSATTAAIIPLLKEPPSLEI
jgi:hypothetical protein